MTGHGKNSVCVHDDCNPFAPTAFDVTTSNWTTVPKHGNAKPLVNLSGWNIQKLFVGRAIDAEVLHAVTTSTTPKDMINMTKPTTTRGDKVKHSFPHPGPHSKFVLLSVSSEGVK